MQSLFSQHTRVPCTRMVPCTRIEHQGTVHQGLKLRVSRYGGPRWYGLRLLLLDTCADSFTLLCKQDKRVAERLADAKLDAERNYNKLAEVKPACGLRHIMPKVHHIMLKGVAKLASLLPLLKANGASCVRGA